MLKRSLIVVAMLASILLVVSHGYAFRDNIVAAWTFEENVKDELNNV